MLKRHTRPIVALIPILAATTTTLAQSAGQPALFRTLDEAMASGLYEPVEDIGDNALAARGGFPGLACAQPPDGVSGYNANFLSLAEARTFPTAGMINELEASFIYTNAVTNGCPDDSEDPVFATGWQVRIYDVLPDGDIDKSSVTVFDTDAPSANMIAMNMDGGLFFGSVPIVDMRFDLTNGGANAGFAVEAGDCLAIQFRPLQFGIGNNLTCSMFWATGTGGDGQVASDPTSTDTWSFCNYADGDLMLCMDYVGSTPPLCLPDFSVAPSNDECDSPMPIPCDTTVEQCLRFATANTVTDPVLDDCATTGGLDPNFTGLNTVWYSVTPASGRVRIDTCGTPGDPNFLLQVFRTADVPGTGVGPCDLVLLACSDNECGNGATVCLNDVTPGEELIVQVGAVTPFDAAILPLNVTCDPMKLPELPTNDECANATQIFANPMPAPSEVATHVGSTFCASFDPNAHCSFVDTPGVWFEAVGDGTAWLLSLVGVGAEFDTLLSVYCGDCDGPLTCLETTEMTDLLFCTEAGRTYYFFVTGFLEVGDFEFRVSADADSLGGCVNDPSHDVRCVTCDVDCIGYLGGPPDINEETDAAALMEMCGSDVNSGCYDAPRNTDFIEAGFLSFSACGKIDAEGPKRDVDSYRFTVETRSVVTFRLLAEFTPLYILYDGDGGEDCDFSELGEILFTEFGDAEKEIVLIETLDPGTHVLFVTVGSFSGTPCGECNDYVLQVTSLPFCAGDCDGNRSVNFADFVAMLGEFGNSGFEPACDADGSGSVDFGDLVAALGVFGDCP